MAPVAKNKNPNSKKNNLSKEKVVSAQLQKKLDKNHKKKFEKKADRGVLLIRHLPKGFFEDQIKGYFAQFGHVTRVRLARSRKTGGSKCFAFIEFKIPEVAQIAAETMDNYLMFQKLVKAHYIPPSEQKFDFFRTRVRRVINSHGKAIFTSRKMISKIRKAKKHNLWTDETYNGRVTKSLKKLEKMKKKYSELGLNLDSIVIKPKLVVPSKKLNSEDMEESITTDTEENEGKPGKLLLVKKRKLSNRENGENKKMKNQESSLKQLLGNTINDGNSSVDEDYLPVEDYDPNETLEIPESGGAKKLLSKKLCEKLENVESDSYSDESYEPSASSDDEDDGDEEEDSMLETESNSEDDDTDEIDEEDESESNLESDGEDNINNNKLNKKSKFDKETRLEKMIRRKPHTGGITKKNIKPKIERKLKKSNSNIQLGKMKTMMAHEMTKEKGLKKVKKADLRIKGV